MKQFEFSQQGELETNIENELNSNYHKGYSHRCCHEMKYDRQSPLAGVAWWGENELFDVPESVKLFHTVERNTTEKNTIRIADLNLEEKKVLLDVANGVIRRTL